ncbi:MAG: YncE family protein [Proteobacteria bacterium]|nr:YncE family protein [Pseudomonadota bacterium]
MYVCNRFSDNVSVIDTITNTRVCADIQVGKWPVSATLVGTNLYVFGELSRNISVIDTKTNTRLGADIQVGSIPVSATLAGTNSYVLNYGSHNISVIDTTTNTRLGADIPVGIGPRSAKTIAGNLLITCDDGLYLMHLDRLAAQLRTATSVVDLSASSAPSTAPASLG